jgi:hypothetical protein
VRSILKFVLVVVPPSALATGVVIAASGTSGDTTAVADGDLQQDLKLAAATSIELAPLGSPLATISAIEAPPSAAPRIATKPKRSIRGPRALRSRRPTVKAAPEPEVAESAEEARTSVVMESAGASAEAAEVAPAEGGVALPRPTAIPVSFPGTGGGMGGHGDGGVYGGGGGGGGIYGPGTVIRGGGVDGDHCQIHGGWGRPRPTTYPRSRGGSLGDRIRAAQGAAGGSRTSGGSIGDRIRAAQGRASDAGGGRSSGGSLAGRIRAAQARR